MSTLLAILTGPAGLAIVASIVFASVNGMIMGLLYLRRRSAERKAAREKISDIAISRQLITLIQQDDFAQNIPPLAALDQQQLHRVFVDLMRLLRGEEYERLLKVADLMGLPDVAVAQLDNSLSARRVDALRVLEQFPVPRAIEALVERMGNDPDESVRLEAAAALARIDHLPPPHDIIEMLGLRHRQLNRLHEAIFRTSALKYAHDLVVLTLDVSLVHVRPLLVEALGWSRDFSMLPVIAEHAESTDPETRSAALRAARELGHPGIEDWVVPMLRDPVEHVRAQAARTAGKLNLRGAIPLLTEMADDPSWWVRKRAIDALERITPRQPFPAKDDAA